jgi:phosphoglycolate phosphatase
LKPYKLIIFDWDGTLIDSVPRIIHIFERTFEKLGLPQPDGEAIKPLIGLPLAEACHRLHPAAGPADLVGMVEIYRFFWLHPDIALSPLVEGVPELLDGLNQDGYTLAVATGKSRDGLERELGVYGLEHHFAATRCASETEAKPHPEMLHQILAELGFKASETLMIGDTGLDLEMAKNAGIDAVGVLTGGHKPKVLAAHEPVGILDHAVQLTDFLNGTV